MLRVIARVVNVAAGVIDLLFGQEGEDRLFEPPVCDDRQVVPVGDGDEEGARNRGHELIRAAYQVVLLADGDEHGD